MHSLRGKGTAHIGTYVAVALCLTEALLENGCLQKLNIVIWYVNLCTSFLQNPLPVLFLIYYSSKSVVSRGAIQSEDEYDQCAE